MAATQGEYSSVNVKKLNAASGEKMAPSASPRVETVVPVSTAMVLTTASFAEKPVMSAVEARQSAKPSGANTGAMTLPMPASILAELSATTLKRMSKDCKNQMMMVATKMTVNARVRKSLALSHSSSPTLLGLGRR